MVTMATVMSTVVSLTPWQPSCQSNRCFTGAYGAKWQPSCQINRCFTGAHGANDNRHAKATVVSLAPMLPMATVMLKQSLFHWRPWCHWQPSCQSTRCFTGAHGANDNRPSTVDRCVNNDLRTNLATIVPQRPSGPMTNLNLMFKPIVRASREPGHEGDQLQPEQEGPDGGANPPPPLRVHGQARQAHQEAHIQVLFSNVRRESLTLKSPFLRLFIKKKFIKNIV